MNLHRTNIEKVFERNHSVCGIFIQKEKINNEYCTYGHKWECAHWYPHRQRDPLRAPHLVLSQFCWRCPPWSDELWFPYIERQLASPVLNKEDVRTVLRHNSVKRTLWKVWLGQSYQILCGQRQIKCQTLFSNVCTYFGLEAKPRSSRCS